MMEKIPAACAMQWSIDLEKGLRSQNLDQRIKAIEHIGMKLQEWSIEPNITMEVADMFSLVPGEDRMFANTILLRLADTFRSGDNKMRSCILEVFLLELRHINKKGKRYNGILAKRRVPNYVELLKRVKIVFDTGDTEARALALRLLGCWADLAKDNAHIRHIVLSTFRSCHVSEVKASLFAAGCFSLLSEDFACIAMEILVDIIHSSRSSSDIVLTGIHAFSKLRCSSFVTNKAYKVGKKLVLGTIGDDYKAAMLLSLSQLAFKSPILVAEQVHLLVSFLSKDFSFLVMTRALQCLYLILHCGAYPFTMHRSILAKIYHIVGNTDLPLSFQCSALKILRKVFNSSLLDQCAMDITDIVKGLLVMSKELKYSLKAKRNLALHLLVDIFFCLKKAGRVDLHANPKIWLETCFQLDENPQLAFLDFEGDCLAHLACQVASLVMDYISFLIRHILAESSRNLVGMKILPPFCEAKEECKSLLSLILPLAKEYPQAGYVLFDRVRTLVQVMDDLDYAKTIKGPCSLDKVSRADLGAVIIQPHESDEQISMFSELMTCIIRFTSACLTMLNDVCSVNSEASEKLMVLAESLQKSKIFNFASYEIFVLCMQSYISCYICDYKKNLDKKNTCDRQVYNRTFLWIIQEWRSLEFIKNMLKTRNYWAAYRVGKYALSEGLWFAAAFAFKKLINHIQSDSLRCWLKCLLLLAGSESEIKLLLYPNDGTRLIDGLNSETKLDAPIDAVFGDMNLPVTACSNLHGCESKVERIHCRMCSAMETLPPDTAYYFQRWFLSLRVMFLETIVDVLGIQKSLSIIIENLNSVEGNGKVNITEIRQSINSLMPRCTESGLKFNKLAKRYDFVVTSFMDIDCQSSRSISAMALNCSLLAFCTFFTLYFLHLPVYNSIMSFDVGKTSSTTILRDLVERLWGIDDNITAQLWQFSTTYFSEVDRLHFDRPNYISSQTERALSLDCQFVISGILQIKKDANRVKDEKDLVELLLQGLHLLSESTRRLLDVPFWVPKYFFRVSPCIGAELFVFNADCRSKNELSVTRGSQLSLNICIQMKNSSRKLCSQVTRLYCILAVRPSNQLPMELSRKSSFHALNDEMFDLNYMLHKFVKANTGKTTMNSIEDSDRGDMVISFACFEPNEKGQGFSSCLLDVSTFPKGSYQIKWHSCCIDQRGAYWSLLPQNTGPLFTIKKPQVSFLFSAG